VKWKGKRVSSRPDPTVCACWQRRQLHLHHLVAGLLRCLTWSYRLNGRTGPSPTIVLRCQSTTLSSASQNSN